MRALQYLRLPGERIMKLAEELYQAGFLSYPRTETDQFDPGYDLPAMIQQQVRGGGRWAGVEVMELRCDGPAAGEGGGRRAGGLCGEGGGWAAVECRCGKFQR